jgi:hypothetical protein
MKTIDMIGMLLLLNLTISGFSVATAANDAKKTSIETADAYSLSAWNVAYADENIDRFDNTGKF